VSRGTFVGTTNLITNPSAEGGSSGWSAEADPGVTATVSDTTAISWVGSRSFLLRPTVNTAAAGAVWALVSPAMPVTAGHAYSCQARTRVEETDIYAFLSIRFYNSSGTMIKQTTEAETPNQTALIWHQHRIGEVAPTSAIQARVVVHAKQQFGNQVNVDTWIDGLQLEEGNGSPYCDGDQPGCIWNGTPHNSTSTRDAVEVSRGTIGKYGVLKILPELYICNRDNVMQTNISDWILNGNVQLDTDSDVQMTFNAQILYPDRLHPFQDFLAPWLTVVYADGTFRKEQVGLYVVVPMNKTYTWHDTIGNLDGRDLTWLVAQQSFPTTYKFGKGKNFIDTVREILEGAGFFRHNIRDSDRKSGRERSWPPGTSKLEIINELLTACSFYKLYADRQGVLRSFPFIKIDKAQVSGTYRSGDGSYTIEPFDMTPSLDSLANYIVVIKDDAEAKPGHVLKAVRKNTNPASPTSIPNIGTIMKVVSDSNLADQDAVDAMADKLQDEWSNVYIEATLHTFPEPWHDPHEVYELDLQQRERQWQYWDRGLFIDLATGKRHKGVLLDDGTWANPDYKTPAAEELRGRFLVKGWRLSFSADDATSGGMDHTISRIVPYGTAVI
jgi:hypothetical protein